MRIMWMFILGLLVLNCQGAEKKEIYCGEPLAEALYDLVLAGGIVISHDLSQTSKLSRTDVFKLRNRQLLVISSTSPKIGEPYTITKLQINTPTENKVDSFKTIPAFRWK